MELLVERRYAVSDSSFAPVNQHSATYIGKATIYPS